MCKDFFRTTIRRKVERSISSSADHPYCNQNPGAVGLDPLFESEEGPRRTMESSAHWATKTSNPTKQLLIAYLLIGLCVVGIHSWSQNLYVRLIQNVTKVLNKSSCWICTQLPRSGEEPGIPLIGLPIPFKTNWNNL